MGIFPETMINEVLRRLSAGDVLHKINYRPEMIQDAGHTLKCFCPIHKETVFRTLLLDKKSKRYRCSNFSCPGGSGGDLIDLYARANAVGYEQALLDLVGAFGIKIDLSAVEQYLTDSLEVAQNYMDLGVLKEAEEHYEKILSFREDCQPALEGLLRIYTVTERWDDYHRARLMLARIHAARQQFKDALELIEASLNDHPGDAELRRFLIECLEGDGQLARATQETLQLGDALVEAGEVDRALETYRLAENFDVGTAASRIVKLLLTAGRGEEAIAECLAQVDRRLKLADSDGAAEQLLAALEIDPSREDLCLRLAGVIAKYRLDDPLLTRTCEEFRKLLAVRAHGPLGQCLDLLEGVYADHPVVVTLRADLEDARGNRDRALELYLHGIDHYYERRDYPSALAILDRIIATRTGNAPLLMRKANILRESGAAAEALPVYLEIIDLYKQAGEYENAAGVFQTLIELNPDRLDLRERQLELYLTLGLETVIVQKAMELAEFYRSRNDLIRAARMLGRALQRAPQSHELLIAHAEFLEGGGRRAEAAEQFLDAAQLFLGQKTLDAAHQAITRALRCVPEHLNARETQADVLVLQENTLQAMSIYADLAEFYLREKDAGLAVRCARKLLALQPENIQALLTLAKAYGLAGDQERQLATQTQLIQFYLKGQSYTRATEICEEILSRHDDYTPALEQMVAIAQASRQSGNSVKYLWKLTQVHARAGRREEEIQILEQIIETDPVHFSANYRHLELLTLWETPQVLAEAISRFVQRHEMAGIIEQALDILSDLVRAPSPKPEIHAGLARLYRIKGDLENLRTALRSQAELLGRLQRDDEALEVWNELARLLPEDFTIIRMRIEIMLRNNMMNEVVEENRRLATGLIERRRYEEGEIALLEILALSPGDLAARNELISILIRTRQFDRAAEQVEEAAGRLLEEARYAEAIAVFERIFEFDTTRDDIHRKIIAIRQRLGEPQAILEHYGRLLDCLEGKDAAVEFEQNAQEAIKLYPDSIPLRQRLASFYAYHNRQREAESILLTLAVRQIEGQQPDDAERTLEKILALNPNSVPARAHHAQILARRGQTQEALNEFITLTGALAMASLSPSAHAGDCAFTNGNYEGIPLIKDYTFDTFIVGSRNNFAYATALAVSRAPAKNYNPLFLYSDVGLGKTHLCHAIAHSVADRHPELKVLYTTTEEFVAELIDAIQNNTISAFRSRHKAIDALIVDDVQFLSGKERAQEEFFNVFNSLYQAGKQVILTSDRPPKDIVHLEKRLRSRFGAGIIVDIQSPDLETRIAILRHELKVRGREGALGDDLLLFVSESVESNVRELKGMLNQLLARQDFSGQRIDLTTAQQLIAQHMAAPQTA